MRKPVLITLAVLTVLLGGGYFMLRPEPVTAVQPHRVSQADLAELQTVGSSRVFFAHQSIGESLVETLPSIFSSVKLDGPATVAYGTQLPSAGGFLVHTHIGTNGDPLGKIAEFDRILRSGLADEIDVAVLKLCYVDFNAQTDARPIFESYRKTMAALARDYPDISFVYATAPLMADRDWFLRLKAMLGRAQEYDPAHNAARERFNSLIRAEYRASGRLFDVAAAEAVGHGDTLTYKSSPAGEFLAMQPALTSDGGHLNTDGANLVARNWLSVLARAGKR